MKSKIVICVLLLSFFNARAEMIDRIVAKVDNDIITLYDLEKLKATLPAYQDMYQVYKNFETKTEKALFLIDMLINDMLIEKEAEKYDILASEDDIITAINDLASQNNMTYDEFVSNVYEQGIDEQNYKDMIKNQIEKMRFYSKFVNSKVMVSENEVLDFFKEKKDFFKKNVKVGFYHILFSTDDGGEDAKKLAGAFLDDFKKAGSFDKIKESYLGKENIRMTNKMTLKIKDLAKEFKDTISTLSPGEATGIIENASGYNIIVLDEIEVISLDSFRDRIILKIQRDKRERMYKSIMSKLRQEHSIEGMY